MCVYVCVFKKKKEKEEEIDQHREERVHQQELDGGCERGRGERGREEERELSLQTPAAVSHFGQAAADRELQTTETSRQVLS